MNFVTSCFALCTFNILLILKINSPFTSENNKYQKSLCIHVVKVIIHPTIFRSEIFYSIYLNKYTCVSRRHDYDE